MQASRNVTELFSLRGKSALVTGGSRGIGLQMAHALGEAGARLLITSRKQDELEASAAALRRAGIETHTQAANLSDTNDVFALIDQAASTLSTIDILVNCAGTTWGAAAEVHPMEAWDKIMALNTRSVFLLTREVAQRFMLPRGQGRIVNVASIAALGGTSRTMQAAAYHASKGALATLTKALACEWGPRGINVNAILPGVFPTRMARHLMAEETLSAIVEHLPLRRIGDEEALKGAVLLLASDAGKHITGVLLPVDGGAAAVVGV